MFQKYNQGERLEEFQRSHKLVVILDDIFHYKDQECLDIQQLLCIYYGMALCKAMAIRIRLKKWRLFPDIVEVTVIVGRETHECIIKLHITRVSPKK